MHTARATAPVPGRATAFLGVSLLLGILADLLLRASPIGINVFLWMACLIGVGVTLAAAYRVRLAGDGRWLLLPALGFAGAVAWRASPQLQALNLSAMLLTLALAAFHLRGGRVHIGNVTEYAWSCLYATRSIAAGAVVLCIREVPWRRMPFARAAPGLRGGLRGIVLAVPLVALFGGLFVAADAVFAQLLRRAVDVDLTAAGLHVAWALTWAWVAAGVLWQCLVEEPPEAPQVPPPPAWRLGPIEVSTTLGLLDLLFLAFVAVQVRYLFGGASHVEHTVNLTYAEYARRGFFELLAVAVLVLPVVLGVHWLLRDSSRSLKLAFRILALALVGLVFVVIASALQRMDAYVDEFGLTRLRFYSTALMAWLVLVFLWLGAAVLRGNQRGFAFGTLAAGLAVVVALNVINPDRVIVETNMDKTGRPFDSAYIAGLSADATPTVIARLARLSPPQRCELARAVLSGGPSNTDWRSWNLSRSQAREAIRDSRATLESACP